MINKVLKLAMIGYKNVGRKCDDNAISKKGIAGAFSIGNKVGIDCQREIIQRHVKPADFTDGAEYLHRYPQKNRLSMVLNEPIWLYLRI